MSSNLCTIDSAFKVELVAALRSGDYVQARGYLRTPHGYCCLGVAADLAGCTWEERSDGNAYVAAWKGRTGTARMDLAARIPEIQHNGRNAFNITFPPAAYDEYTSALVEAHYLDYEPDSNNLTASFLNDWGVPFSVIADLIEKWF